MIEPPKMTFEHLYSRLSPICMKPFARQAALSELFDKMFGEVPIEQLKALARTAQSRQPNADTPMEAYTNDLIIDLAKKAAKAKDPTRKSEDSEQKKEIDITESFDSEEFESSSIPELIAQFKARVDNYQASTETLSTDTKNLVPKLRSILELEASIFALQKTLKTLGVPDAKLQEEMDRFDTASSKAQACLLHV